MASPERATSVAPDNAAGANCRVAFFGHDSAESTVIKRIRSFCGLGLEVLGFTFRREKFTSGPAPFWHNVHLGTTIDRAYGRRLLALLRAFPKVLAERRRLQSVDFFYARNIDMCALAWFAKVLSGSDAPLVYEVLDVQRVFTGRGPVAMLFRWAERRLLKRIALLVVSSPGFLAHYFHPRQGYRGRSFLLENKIGFAQAAAIERPKAPLLEGCATRAAPERWVIGWFGTLRCPRSLEMLCRIAATLPERVEIYLRGLPTETGLDYFRQAIAAHPNITYGGEYRNPEDLEEIYGRVHLTWAFDFLDEGTNSSWLLPNRIYEGGYFGSVALTASDTQTGEKVRDEGLGYTFEAPLVENLVAFLRWYSIDEHLARRAHILSLPAQDFSDVFDTRDLCELILSLPRGAPARAVAPVLPAQAYEPPGE